MSVTIISGPTEDRDYYSHEELYVVVESDRFTGGSPPYTPDEDNLQAYLELYQKTGDVLIVALQAPYDYDTKQTIFNIGRLAPLLYTLPSVASIAGTPLVSGSAASSAMELYFKYGDKFGTPPEPETLSTSVDFFMLIGSRSAENLRSQVLPIESSAPFALLHSYTFMKVVSYNQPDWLYFYAMEAFTVDIDVKLLYEDGSDNTINLDDFAVTAHTAYWIQAGLDQLDIDAEGLYAYTVIFKKSGETATREVTFQIDRTCQDWGIDLIFTNGLGGMESVQLKGKGSHRYEVSRETFKSVRASGFNITDGEIETLDTEGNYVVEASTGFYPRAQAEHLAQLLHGKVWRIRDGAFEKWVVLSQRLTLAEDDEDLFALELELRPGWDNDNRTRQTIAFA